MKLAFFVLVAESNRNTNTKGYDLVKLKTKYFPCPVVLVFIVLFCSLRPAAAQQPVEHKSGGSQSWADRVNLDDLVPYTVPTAAWSDRYSDIAITWTKPDEPGIQRLQSLVGWAGTKITDNLLSWKMNEDGQTLPLKLKHRNYRPDKVIESDESTDLDLT